MLRLGLIGAGRWGRNYIRTINAMPDVQLAAVASSNPQTAEWVEPTTKVIAQWESLLQMGLDGIILAVPPTIQPAIALEAIQAKMPLLLEKPMALDVASAKAIADAACEHEVYVTVNHIYLHHPAYIQLKRTLAENEEPITAIRTRSGNQGPFRQEWDALWDWGPHDVAMALDLMDTEVSLVKADILRDSKDHPTGENYSVTLKQSDGAKAELTFGNMMPRRIRQLEVITEAGEYAFDEEADNQLTLRPSSEETALSVPEGQALKNSISAFTKEIRQRVSESTASSLLKSFTVIELLAHAEALIANRPDGIDSN